MTQLDILFINPNSSKESYQALADKTTSIEIPFWSLLLSSAIISRNMSAAILDCDAERLEDDAACQRIKDLNPKLVCAVVYGSNPSAGICSMAGTIRLFNKLKNLYPEYKTGIVGTYVSAQPIECLNLGCFDFGFIGDGTYALLNTLKTDLKTDLHKINGIVYKEDNIVKINNPEIIVPQNRLEYDLPDYPWELLPYKDKPLDIYRCHNWHNNYDENSRSPFATIYTALGCVKKCQFCVINLINRTNYNEGITSADSASMRFWPTSWVLKQIDKLANLGVKNIRFADELLFANRKYYEPLFDGLIERNYELKTWVYSRCDTVKEKYLPKLQKSGVNYIALGIESASQTIRKLNDKGGMDDVNIRDIVKSIENSGIEVAANYMVGFPEEKMEDMQATMDLATELNTAFMNVHATTFFPGTPLWYTALENKWELPSKFEQYAFFGYEFLPLPTKYVSREEVLKFRDVFWQKYYTNPTFLNSIESKFGTDAKNNIVEMSKIKLKRQLLGD